MNPEPIAVGQYQSWTPNYSYLGIEDSSIIDLLEVQPMNEKPPNSIKPSIQKLLENYEPRPISEVALEPRTTYSTHPRVQGAFRRLVNWKKYEQQSPTTSRPGSRIE